MESNFKIITLSAIMLFITLSAFGQGKNAPPPDIPTIEALIDAHKKMKKAEDIAVLELGAAVETQNITKRMADKYNETRQMLNQRLADVSSAVSLASAISSVTLQLKDLVESYADFTVTAYNNALRQPFLILVYVSANAEIGEEIKRIVLNCFDYAMFETNLLKATMEEKRQILDFISMHISSVQRIINRASRVCSSVIAVGVQQYHVEQLINSETNKKLIDKVIGKWKGNIGLKAS